MGSLPQCVSKENNVVLGAEMTSNSISIENAVKDSKTTKNSKTSSRQCSDSAQIQGAGTNKVNIFLGASGTEDDSGSGSNNSGSVSRHYNRKLFHRRQRIPPKKLEVRTPSVQDSENSG